MIKLYTQNNCDYCDIMKQNLNNWNINFETINISENSQAKNWLKEKGHKTVPVLYLDDFWINEKIDTKIFTERMFYDRIDIMIEQKTSDELDELIERYETQ
jgi:glutaredoxin